VHDTDITAVAGTENGRIDVTKYITTLVVEIHIVSCANFVNGIFGDVVNIVKYSQIRYN